MEIISQLYYIYDDRGYIC